MSFTYFHWKYLDVLFFYIVMTTGSRQTSAHIRDTSMFDSTVEPESHVQGTSMSSVGKINTISYRFYKIIKCHVFFFINDFLVPFSFKLH